VLAQRARDAEVDVRVVEGEGEAAARLARGGDDEPREAREREAARDRRRAGYQR
jgi:hypothetical protein